ncbi:hypothetical protein I3760_05G098100 [Carya illinoinensis]|nr:hypothetical protein I3760_05G098100 [Carya illinoinensis]
MMQLYTYQGGNDIRHLEIYLKTLYLATGIGVAGFLRATPAVMVNKQRSSFSSWSVYQKRNNLVTTFKTSILWWMILSQSAQVLQGSSCNSNK